MAQLNFAMNFHYTPGDNITINNGSLSFVPFLINDSISFNIINFVHRRTSNAADVLSFTLSFGLYSLNGSTLSLANSASRSQTYDRISVQFISLTATSATQNITPGTWWFGIWPSSSGANNILQLKGQKIINDGNAFLGCFIGGAMTVSTNALPSSYATSDLDITGSDALLVPMIIISA